MQLIQSIFSPDGSLRAQVFQRPDATFRVIFSQRQEADGEKTWQDLPGETILSTLDDAIVFAGRHLGIERVDWDDEE